VDRLPIIAIDGPSGAGKGTVARALARALGFRHVDTGAMYRAVAWRALDRGASLEDEAAVTGVAADAAFELEGGRVIVDGIDVTHAIRTPDIDSAASRVARLEGVRRVLVDRQREIGAGGGVVMEGRDIGTIVFPGADLKIYLDASPAERARRRAADPAHTPADTVHVADALAERDRRDLTRTASPLRVADDAVIVQTDGLTPDEVVGKVLELVRARTGRPA
jgi:cytidylate kinase